MMSCFVSLKPLQTEVMNNELKPLVEASLASRLGINIASAPRRGLGACIQCVDRDGQSTRQGSKASSPHLLNGSLGPSFDFQVQRAARLVPKGVRRLRQGVAGRHSTIERQRISHGTAA